MGTLVQNLSKFHSKQLKTSCLNFKNVISVNDTKQTVRKHILQSHLDVTLHKLHKKHVMQNDIHVIIFY